MQYRMAPHRVQTHISYRIPHYRVPTAQAASPTPGEVFFNVVEPLSARRES